MLQLESIWFATATLATQLESIQFGTATLATQLQSIRFPVHTLTWKASDLVPLFWHRNLKASALLSLFLHNIKASNLVLYRYFCIANSRPLYFDVKASDLVPLLLQHNFQASDLVPLLFHHTSKHPIWYRYFATHLHSIRFGTATWAPQLQSIQFQFRTVTLQHTFKASDLVPDIFQNNTASRYVFILPTWPFSLQKVAFLSAASFRSLVRLPFPLSNW